MDEPKQVVSAFTLGYLLSFLKNHAEENESKKNVHKTVLLFSNEINSTIKDLCADLSYTSSEIDLSLTKLSELNLFIENLDQTFFEKDHWGDDSFRKVAFFLGRFLSLIRVDITLEFDLGKLEKILFELLCMLKISVDIRELYKTTSMLISNIEWERKNSCDEVFYLISGNGVNVKKMKDCQNLINNFEGLAAFAYS